MYKRQLVVLTVLVLSTLGLAGCGTSLMLPVSPSETTPPAIILPDSTEVPARSPVSAEDQAGTMAAFEGSLEELYEYVNPSVVNIRVVQKDVVTSTIPEIPGFPFFGQPSPEQPQERFQQASGSGFVWDQEGHIVTNNHVVDGANEIEVTFADGTVRQATLVGADPDSDLAVVKVEDMSAEALQPVQLADSTQLKVGQLAIAIGNPFGLEGTMTVGIVSALGRSLPADASEIQGSSYTIPDIIQTDAPINPGNSGGVLVDDQGMVIGVTSAIVSPVQASAGIGFAIPSVIVQNVVPSLISDGRYEHAWLGISGTSLSPDLAEAMGLDVDQRGALVIDVVSASPADEAGLRGSDREVTINGQQVRVGGDVIVAIDKEAVKSFDDLVAYLARHTQVGQKVELAVLRGGENEMVEVTLAARRTTEPMANQSESSGRGAWLGIMGMTLTPEIAQTMDLDQNQRGVLVEQVEAGSPADKAGLRGSYKPVKIDDQQILVGGDVIVGVDDKTVETIQELQSILLQAEPGQQATLSLLRNGETIDVVVTLGERPAS
jgi:serine protease Do